MTKTYVACLTNTNTLWTAGPTAVRADSEGKRSKPETCHTHWQGKPPLLYTFPQVVRREVGEQTQQQCIQSSKEKNWNPLEKCRRLPAICYFLLPHQHKPFWQSFFWAVNWAVTTAQRQGSRGPHHVELVYGPPFRKNQIFGGVGT